MNRSLLYATAFSASIGLAAVPALAQSNANANGNANGTTTMEHTNGSASTAQHIVNQAAQTVNQIKQDHAYDQLLRQAKAIYVVPNLDKGAFVVGGEGGQGVLLKRDSNGSWSDPAFLNIGSVSIGAQVGGAGGPVAMLLMSNKALNQFEQTNKFSLTGNAGLTIANYQANGQAPSGNHDVVIWSAQNGAFAGVSLKGAELWQNTGRDQSYYGKQVDAQQILNGHVTNPGSRKLIEELPS